MHVVCFGQQNWDHCWTGKQQLLTRLAARGHRVLYLDPEWAVAPLSRADGWRACDPARTRLGLREAQERLFVFTYHYAPPLRWRLNRYRWNSGRVARSLCAQLGFTRAVALTLRPHRAQFVNAIEPLARVYYAVDEWTAFGQPEEEHGIWRAREEALLRESDVALCVSVRLHRRFLEHQPRSYVLENGADVDHFSPESLDRHAPHPALAALPFPRVGCIGQIDERVDQDLLVAIARARRDWHIVLAGRVRDGTDVSRLEAEPNVHLLGYQPYDALPGILREVQVCLLPYRQTLLTHSCNPLKVFEYLATGRPIVAAPLDGLGVTRSGVALAETTEEFIASIDGALQQPDRGREQRLAIARANTWDARVDALEAYLREAVTLASEKSDPHSALGPRLRPSRPARRWARRIEALSYRSLLAYAAAGTAGWAYYIGRRAYRRVLKRRHPEVRRILLLRANCYLGDLITFLPTLRVLRHRYPEARMVLAVHGMPPATAAELAPYVDEVRPLSDLRRASRVSTGRALRLFVEGFDVVISGAGYFLHRESLFCGAPYRLGLDEGHPLEALNTHVVPLDPTRHEADNNLALVELLSGPVPAEWRIPCVVADQARVREGIDRLLTHLEVPGDSVLLTLHVGSKLPSRRWPLDRFAHVAAAFLERCPPAHVVLSGVAGEGALIESVRQEIPPTLRARTHSAAGLTDLSALIGLLDRSAVVVSNDTGTMHLARARGRPLVALMGPENDCRWGPHPEGPGRVVSLRHEVPCAPCRRHACDHLWCMRCLSVREVLDQLWPMLEAPTEGAVPRRDRQVQTHAWRSLSLRGMSIPLVTVVCWFDPPPEGAAPKPTRVWQSLARQEYPALELVLLGDYAGSTPLVPCPVRAIASDRLSRHEAWRAALASARGEIVVSTAADVDWPSHYLGDRVARLVRQPAIPVLDAHGHEITEPVAVPDGLELAGRREALLAWAEGTAPNVAGRRVAFSAQRHA